MRCRRHRGKCVTKMSHSITAAHLFMVGDIKYSLPLPAWGEMNLRWVRLVVTMGHGLVVTMGHWWHALAGHLYARGELVVMAGSWGAHWDWSHLNWGAKPEAAQHRLSPMPSSRGLSRVSGHLPSDKFTLPVLIPGCQARALQAKIPL